MSDIGDVMAEADLPALIAGHVWIDTLQEDEARTLMIEVWGDSRGLREFTARVGRIMRFRRVGLIKRRLLFAASPEFQEDLPLLPSVRLLAVLNPEDLEASPEVSS